MSISVEPVAIDDNRHPCVAIEVGDHGWLWLEPENAATIAGALQASAALAACADEPTKWRRFRRCCELWRIRLFARLEVLQTWKKRGGLLRWDSTASERARAAARERAK